MHVLNLIISCEESHSELYIGTITIWCSLSIWSNVNEIDHPSWIKINKVNKRQNSILRIVHNVLDPPLFIVRSYMSSPWNSLFCCCKVEILLHNHVKILWYVFLLSYVEASPYRIMTFFCMYSIHAGVCILPFMWAHTLWPPRNQCTDPWKNSTLAWCCGMFAFCPDFEMLGL
jgi:hypothetical protein